MELLVIVGATATGKSDLAIALAQHLHGEVINADSMQVYQGLNIGTGKLTNEQQQGVPHHLLDVWPISKAANVAEYQQLARDCVAEIQNRGRLPILVGGSGLYVRAVVDDLRFPGHDPQIRQRLVDEAEQRGPAHLYQRLKLADPKAAEMILPGNTRRIIRALEVIELTGETFTASLPEPTVVLPHHTLGLDMPRADLHLRIEQRVQRMWDNGWVRETQQLLAEADLAHSPTAQYALGYRQIIDWLAHGRTESEAQVMAETIRLTKKFARRQLAWFRRDPTTRWVDARTPPAQILQQLGCS